MNASEDGFRDESSKQKSDLMAGHWGMRNLSRRESIDRTIRSLSRKFWHQPSTVAGVAGVEVETAEEAHRHTRAEIALLQDMGMEMVQIDDPHLCLFVDPDVRRKYDDPDRAADFAVDMINETVRGFDDVKFAVHLCRRAGARVRGEKHHAGTYGPILKQLNNLRVRHLTMEFTAAGADDLESLGRLREDFELGLGVVDVTPGAPEAATLIAARVERALTRIDRKRITLNPDCGFAPGSAARVDTDEVYLKLKAEVEAARMLRAKYA